MVTRILIVDAAHRVRLTANWCHSERLEPFILGNLADGDMAYAVTVRTPLHFVDYAAGRADRSADHMAMLRQAREPAVQEFVGAAHRITMDCTRGADGALYAHAAYAVKTEANGVPSFATQIAMPDEVIDGKPRPLYRRRGDRFERFASGAWCTHESEHAQHQLAMEAQRSTS